MLDEVTFIELFDNLDVLGVDDDMVIFVVLFSIVDVLLVKLLNDDIPVEEVNIYFMCIYRVEIFVYVDENRKERFIVFFPVLLFDDNDDSII